MSRIKEFKEIELIKLNNNPFDLFPLYDGAELNELVESIKLYGVLEPLIVRKEDIFGRTYRILAGKNRKHAGELAGLEKVPCVIMPDSLTEEEERLIVIETNLRQRAPESMKTSVLAKAIAEWYSLIKKQGLRTDLLEEIDVIELKNSSIEAINDDNKKNTENTSENPHKTEGNNTFCHIVSDTFEAAEIIAEKTKLSPRNIYRYLQIAKLSDELLKYVDDGIIPFLAAVELSYLTPTQMEYIKDILTVESIKVKNITIDNAKRLRLKSEKKNLNSLKDVIDCFKSTAKVKKADNKVTIKSDFVSSLLKNTPKKVAVKKVERSLELTEKKIPQLLSELNVEFDEEELDEIILAAIRDYCGGIEDE